MIYCTGTLPTTHFLQVLLQLENYAVLYYPIYYKEYHIMGSLPKSDPYKLRNRIRIISENIDLNSCVFLHEVQLISVDSFAANIGYVSAPLGKLRCFCRYQRNFDPKKDPAHHPHQTISSLGGIFFLQSSPYLTGQPLRQVGNSRAWHSHAMISCPEWCNSGRWWIFVGDTLLEVIVCKLVKK